MTEEKNQITLGEHRGLWLANEKTVKFRPWKGRQEAELSDILHKGRHKLEGGRICKRVSLILQYMCVEIGGVKFWEQTDTPGEFREVLTQDERELHISKMWETDVLTAFFLLRMATVDSECDIPVSSPFDQDNKRVIVWHGDIADLPFMGANNIEECLWEYDLIDPAVVRGKEITKVVFGPMRWRTAEDLKIKKPGPANMKAIAGTIHKVPEFSDEAISFSFEDLFDFSKRDLGAIEKKMDEKHNGLDLSIELYDEHAEQTFEASVPWMHPDFFAISSQ